MYGKLEKNDDLFKDCPLFYPNFLASYKSPKLNLIELANEWGKRLSFSVSLSHTLKY